MTVRCKIHKKWKDIKIVQLCKIAKSKLELWLNRLYQESTVFDVCIKPIHTEAQNSRTKSEKTFWWQEIGQCVWCFHALKMTPIHGTPFTSNLKV
jgi:hypothetical protein